MSTAGSPRRGHGARALARKLALQALYAWQLNPGPWQDMVTEYDLAEEAPRADREHFTALVSTITTGSGELDEQLRPWLDRQPAELDPIEHAVLWIGLQELRNHPEVPFRVAISEAVGLAKRFGATDGHKFVNAIMDKAARALRPHEH
jgi:N utilization substance protein B